MESISPFSNGNSHPSLQYVTWVVGSTALLIVYKNDVYFKKSPSATGVVRLTTSGENTPGGVVYNGLTDFLYYSEFILRQRTLGRFLDGFILLLVSDHVPFFHVSYSGARGILCGTHTPCMGAPFFIVYTKWSLVFRSFGSTLH